MRPLMAIGRVLLSAAAGYGAVWAYSDPDPEWATARATTLAAEEPSGSARAALSEDEVETSVAGLPAIARAAPPFEGLSLPAAAIELARQAEPLRLEPVQEASGAWVIGYGRRVAERPLREISRADAEAMLREDLAAAEIAVRSVVQIPLSDNEYGALVEFTRSIGVDNFANTLVITLINAGDREAAADAFLLWTMERVDGALVESPDLVAQRRRTRALFLTGADTAGS